MAKGRAVATSEVPVSISPEELHKIVHELRVRCEEIVVDDDESGSTVYRIVLSNISESMRTEAAITPVSDLKRSQDRLEHLNRSLREQVETTVTELRQKDQVLISQNRQAAMGEMIGNIAHQWRQPLNALSLLMANLQFAQMNGEFTEALMNESATTANRLIQKMSTTIDDFRNFFRPDKEKGVFSALDQVNLTVQMVEKAFSNNSIAIVVDNGHDCTLWGFANEFSQVLLNLLGNARDAIVDLGITSGMITIAAREKNGMGVITVRDNGGGVPEAILDKIFEPYFSTKETGTGIGLYMSKMIIERNMGGRITVDHVGDGCQFTLAIR